MATSIQPTDPVQAAILGPDILAQQYKLQRAQQLAQLLQQNSMQDAQGPAGEMVSGHYVPTYNGLKSLGTAFIAAKMGNDLPQMQADVGNAQMAAAVRSFGGGGAPAPQAAEQALGAGAAQGDAGPTVANAARMDTLTSGQPSNNSLFPRLNGMDARQSAMSYLSMGPSEYMKALASQLAPTDMQKNNNYLGISAPEAAGWARNEANVKGVLPIRQGMTIGKVGPDGNVTPTFTAPDQDNGTYTTWGPNGPTVAAIPGATDVKKAMSVASATGSATFKPGPTQYGKNGQPLPVMSEAETFTPPQPQAGGGSSGNSPQAFNDQLAILQSELDKPPKGVDVSAWNAGLQREIANVVAKSRSAGVAPQERGTPVPPLGASAAADTSQTGAPKAMNESYGALQKARAGGSAALQDIDHMLELGSKKSPLVAGSYATEIAKIFSPNAAEYEKSRDNLVTQLSGQLGMSTDSARDMVYGSIPAYGAPKQAIQNGLTNLKNQVQQRMMKADFLTPSFNSGNANDYTTRENQFDLNIKPEVVPLLQMPAGAARAKALTEAAKNPQTRASLEWAAQNGLLK